ncbi:TPA: undecaprenyl-phosphate galactose phosphotransferase WbaP [Serratia fonticola]
MTDYLTLSKNSLVKISLAVIDLISFNLSMIISILLIYVFLDVDHIFSDHSDFISFCYAYAILSVVCIAWFWIRLRHYSYRKPFWFELKEMLRTLLIFSVFSLAIIGFSKWEVSRYFLVLTWTITFILLPILRISVKHLLNRLGLWKKQTIIIGSKKNALEAYMALQSEEVLGFDVVAFYSVSETDKSNISGIDIITDEERLWEMVSPNETQFIVALEFDEHLIRDYWLRKLAKHDCRSVSVIPTLRGVPLYGTDLSFIFSHEVMILRVSNSLAKRTSRFIKRAFDIVCAILIIIILSPILMFIAFAVSRDGGNAIYGHERVGRNGKKFKCLKFRSMIVNSQEVLDNLLKSDLEARNEWEKDFKLKNDPRITRVGNFLRRTSLDELPQLFNVLLGDMSLVGPRPIVEKELERYAGEVDYYLMAKPGMTGLWQVSGRNDVDYETRVYFDAWYVKNWSLWNDIAILFKTINVVLKRDGAY